MPNTINLPSSLPGSIHATAVNIRDQGLLICGPSGSGKSSLALQLMSLGAVLVSDDLVWLNESTKGICLSRPPQDKGELRIEAHGLGILSSMPAPPTRLFCIVDLSQVETARLPEPRYLRIGNTEVRHLFSVDSPAFPAMLHHYSMQEFLS